MKIGFIGTGHMGGSIAYALRNNPSIRLLLCDKDRQKAVDLSKRIGRGCFVMDARSIVHDSDIVFLGVKPGDIEGLLRKIASVSTNAVVVSMAAGISIAELGAALPSHPVIRILPNTPIAVKKGFTFVAYGDQVTDEQKKIFADLMKDTGILCEIEEEKINAASVITGSAPAYLDYFLDALAEAGVKMGLTKEEATSYALHMAEGAVKLAIASDKSPKQLGEEVCSPGGSTIEGVDVLRKKGLYEMTEEAAMATFRKNGNIK